ncbi:hypothetical protein JCM1840_001529 [Sporobolomyces johnsonii]
MTTVETVLPEEHLLTPSLPPPGIYIQPRPIPLDREASRRLASWDWDGGEKEDNSFGTLYIRKSRADGSLESGVRQGRDLSLGTVWKGFLEDADVTLDDDAMAFRSSCARAISPTSQPPPDDPAPVIGDTSIISFADTSFAQSATSYLSLSAFPSPPLAGEIAFTDPFSFPADPPRPPSRASTLGERRGRVVPALTINPNAARKVSASSSISVYSTASDDFADDSHLQSYFSPISDGDILSPFSGVLSPFSSLAVSASGPLLSPVSPTTEWPKSAPASEPMASYHVSETSLSSTSEQTGSSQPSPLFDRPLPRSSTFTDNASFDRNSPFPELDAPPVLPFQLEKGTWREHWSLEVSAAANPVDDHHAETEDVPDVEEDASDAASVREQELSREEETVLIEEYCERELERRKEERKRRWAVERNLLYGEGEDVEHQFGFAY